MSDSYDASDPQQVKAAEDLQIDMEKDLEAIMRMPRGRRWLHEFLYGPCHIGSPSFVPGDPACTSFNEGARSVGNALNEKLQATSPKLYLTMLEENHFDD